MRCDFYFCPILPKLSEFRELRMVSGLAYSLWGLETSGVHILELFMTFHLQLRFCFHAGAECLCGFSELISLWLEL